MSQKVQVYFTDNNVSFCSVIFHMTSAAQIRMRQLSNNLLIFFLPTFLPAHTGVHITNKTKLAAASRYFRGFPLLLFDLRWE